FYADLARAQRDKVARTESPVIPQVPQVPQVPAAPRVQPQTFAAVPAETPKPPVTGSKPAVIPDATVPPPAEAIKTPAEGRPTMAVLRPPDAGKKHIEPRPDPKGEIRVLTRTLQTELRRVGCDPGTVDGNGSPKPTEAVKLFNRHAGMSLDSESATVSALETV